MHGPTRLIRGYYWQCICWDTTEIRYENNTATVDNTVKNNNNRRRKRKVKCNKKGVLNYLCHKRYVGRPST